MPACLVQNQSGDPCQGKCIKPVCLWQVSAIKISGGRRPGIGFSRWKFFHCWISNRLQNIRFAEPVQKMAYIGRVSSRRFILRRASNWNRHRCAETVVILIFRLLHFYQPVLSGSHSVRQRFNTNCGKTAEVVCSIQPCGWCQLNSRFCKFIDGMEEISTTDVLSAGSPTGEPLHSTAGPVQAQFPGCLK